MVVSLTNYGAKIVTLNVPGKDAKFADVMLGFKSITEYQKGGASQGAVIGPFANRIANAQFTIDGETYQFEQNNAKACLHSGSGNWAVKVWDAEQQGNVTTFTLKTPDGEAGFPGNKQVKVIYTLTEKNELRIDYSITTDKACHFFPF